MLSYIMFSSAGERKSKQALTATLAQQEKDINLNKVEFAHEIWRALGWLYLDVT